MAEFTIEIAGHTARVESLFDSTLHYCAAYLTEKAPQWHIKVTRAAMEEEQRLADAEAVREGFRHRTFSEPFLERAVVQRAMAEHLFRQDVLLLHGSAVALDGRGYLFLAKSGTGKSTHTRLWREQFAQAQMINDDRPFVRMQGQTPMLCGAPWSGKHGLHTNLTAALCGICILRRGREDHIRPACPEEALPILLHETFCPAQASLAARHRELVEALAQRVPLWSMDCTPTAQAAVLAYRAMAVR